MTESSRVFAISDLHLPGNQDKSMDLFGAHWQDHFLKIQEDWHNKVGEEDIVLIPGDISWAMRLDEALFDLDQIGRLPGRKVMIKGNHDFWWSAISNVRAHLIEGFYALQNDAVALEGYVFAGSRGWVMPGGEDEEPDTQKIYNRELIRLELSLQQAQKLRGDRKLIALCHFPPCNHKGEDTPVTSLLEQYAADAVVYGHLHGIACAGGFRGEKNGIQYYLASCDCIGFNLLEIGMAGAENQR
ncbi:MAG: metallophosphoesterase [Christensenellales bacterium]|jgi:predicted phosphohydrolase|nr:hypothetical protein [Clostridiales bacterium]